MHETWERKRMGMVMMIEPQQKMFNTTSGIKGMGEGGEMEREES